MNTEAKELKVRTAEEIQGVISEIQTSGVSFEKEVELLKLLHSIPLPFLPRVCKVIPSQMQ